MSKKVKVQFANLAEQVLKESNRALPVSVIIDKVAARALTRKLKNGRKPSNRYFREISNGAVSQWFRQDKRFVKQEQDEWRVNLWTLAEE